MREKKEIPKNQEKGGPRVTAVQINQTKAGGSLQKGFLQ